MRTFFLIGTFLLIGLAAAMDYACPVPVTVTEWVRETLVSCCPTCEVITVTASTQPISSWSTTSSATSTVCQTSGVFTCGSEVYTCSHPPCSVEYEAPCSTCYVCPYNECWAPNLKGVVTQHIQVWEYLDHTLCGYSDEEWECEVSYLFLSCI